MGIGLRVRSGTGGRVCWRSFRPPDGVVAMRATGTIDEADIERAITAVEAALAARDRIAVYAEIDIAGMTPAEA